MYWCLRGYIIHNVVGGNCRANYSTWLQGHDLHNMGLCLGCRWFRMNYVDQIMSNIGYPSKPKLCKEHGSDTAVLYVRFQSDWSTEAWVMGKRVFAKSGFTVHYGRIFHIAKYDKTFIALRIGSNNNLAGENEMQFGIMQLKTFQTTKSPH